MTEVRFIRKHGRIIPIRTAGNFVTRQASKVRAASKLAKPEDREMSPAHLQRAADGIAIGGTAAAAAAIGSEELINRTSKFPFTPGRFKSEYFSEIRKAENPVFKPRDGLLSFPSVDIAAKTPIITMGWGTSEATMLHELGHAVSSRRKNTMNAALSKLFRGWEKEIASHPHSAEGALKTLGTNIKAIAFNATARPFVSLVSEAEASGEAVRMAATHKGALKALSVGARLVLPYASYAAGAAFTGMYGLSYYRSLRGPKKQEK